VLLLVQGGVDVRHRSELGTLLLLVSRGGRVGTGGGIGGRFGSRA
jgi:hypothetical protein